MRIVVTYRRRPLGDEPNHAAHAPAVYDEYPSRYDRGYQYDRYDRDARYRSNAGYGGFGEVRVLCLESALVLVWTCVWTPCLHATPQFMAGAATGVLGAMAAGMTSGTTTTATTTSGSRGIGGRWTDTVRNDKQMGGGNMRGGTAVGTTWSDRSGAGRNTGGAPRTASSAAGPSHGNAGGAPRASPAPPSRGNAGGAPRGGARDEKEMGGGHMGGGVGVGTSW